MKKHLLSVLTVGLISMLTFSAQATELKKDHPCDQAKHDKYMAKMTELSVKAQAGDAKANTDLHELAKDTDASRNMKACAPEESKE